MTKYVADSMCKPGMAFAVCAAAISGLTSVRDTCRPPANGNAGGTSGLPSPEATEFIKAMQEQCESQINAESIVEDEDNFLLDYDAAEISLAAYAGLLRTHLDHILVEEQVEQSGTEHEFSKWPCVPRTRDLPWLLPRTMSGSLPMPFMEETVPPASTQSRGPAMRLTDWDTWHQETISKMCETSFLEDGEWCGYWSYEEPSRRRRPARAEFADPVQRMVLRVVTNRRQSSRLNPGRKLLATYPESDNAFQLEGQITPDGIFELGPPGEFWMWKGRMTPFGLFGFWGSVDLAHIAGTCWVCLCSSSAPFNVIADNPSVALEAIMVLLE